MRDDMGFVIAFALVILMVVVFTMCENYWSDGTPNLYRVSKVKKGKHDFDFGVKMTSRSAIRVHCLIPQDYFIDGEDQWDWNKSPGLMTTVHPHISSALGGWRTVNGVVHASPYIHNKDTTTQYLTKDYPVFKLKEWWWYEIYDLGVQWKYVYSTGQEYYYDKVDTDRFYFISGWWFGGTSAAPKDLEVWWYIERL